MTSNERREAIKSLEDQIRFNENLPAGVRSERVIALLKAAVLRIKKGRLELVKSD